MIANAYQILYTIALSVLAVGILLAMIRAIKGPRIADRVVAVNMIGTMTMLAIAVLSLALPHQTYLLDVCLIYVMISFLAVVVLSKIYITVHLDKQEKAQNANPMISYAPTEDGENLPSASASEDHPASLADSAAPVNATPATESARKGGC